MKHVQPESGGDPGGHMIPGLHESDPMKSQSSSRVIGNEAVEDESEALNVEPIVYDEVDRRLIDTFPASDAVARY
jgi:hypothetical protein